MDHPSQCYPILGHLKKTGESQGPNALATPSPPTATAVKSCSPIIHVAQTPVTGQDSAQVLCSSCLTNQNFHHFHGHPQMAGEAIFPLYSLRQDLLHSSGSIIKSLVGNIRGWHDVGGKKAKVHTINLDNICELEPIKI